MAGDPNFDTGSKMGGLMSLNMNTMPRIPSGGQSEGGPSRRRPFAKRNPGKPSLMHRMTTGAESQQMSLPKLPGAGDVQAPVKAGSGPGLFPKGSVDQRGLRMLPF